MGGTHKKNLRAEKAKVKLKGAKLPKGLNVTKTEFKVRKITIREQLKENAAQYVDGQRRLNLKETISRLKHQSSKYRQEALRNLREAISGGHVHPTALLAQLSELIQRVVAITLDVDKETRRESFKTLSSLFGVIPVDTVAPFFHVVASYLCCAMTHIQPQLQEDALLLLDVLLQHTPHLVAQHSAKIFQNFLEMISRVRAEGDRAGRTLVVHMGQQQTTIKWRSKVLLRLQQMLYTLAEHKRLTAEGVTIAQAPMHTFNVREPQHYSLKRSYSGQSPTGADLFSRQVGGMCELSATVSAVEAGVTTTTDEEAVLHNYVEHLMPLLLDAWLEVRPSEANGGSVGVQNILTNEAAVTLKVVLENIENLWRLLTLHEEQVSNHDLSDWFRNNYGEAFAQSFLLSCFPYQQHEQTGVKKSKKGGSNENSGGQHCLPQNVSLAYLMSRFTIPLKLAESSGVLLGFLTTLMAQPRLSLLECLQTLLVALRAFLLENALELLRSESAVEPLRALLRASIKACLDSRWHTGTVEASGAKLLVLLCDIVQRPQLYKAYGAQEFEEFLQYLPKLLLRPNINDTVLIAMSHLGKQQNDVFLKALETQLQAVIVNLQRMQVFGAHSAYEGKKHIMNLFFWTQHNWQQSKAQKEQLIDTVEKHISDKRIVSYFKFILTQS